MSNLQKEVDQSTSTDTKDLTDGHKKSLPVPIVTTSNSKAFRSIIMQGMPEEDVTKQPILLQSLNWEFVKSTAEMVAFLCRNGFSGYRAAVYIHDPNSDLEMISLSWFRCLFRDVPKIYFGCEKFADSFIVDPKRDFFYKDSSTDNIDVFFDLVAKHLDDFEKKTISKQAIKPSWIERIQPVKLIPYPSKDSLFLEMYSSSVRPAAEAIAKGLGMSSYEMMQQIKQKYGVRVDFELALLMRISKEIASLNHPSEPLQFTPGEKVFFKPIIPTASLFYAISKRFGKKGRR